VPPSKRREGGVLKECAYNGQCAEKKNTGCLPEQTLNRGTEKGPMKKITGNEKERGGT